MFFNAVMEVVSSAWCAFMPMWFISYFNKGKIKHNTKFWVFCVLLFAVNLVINICLINYITDIICLLVLYIILNFLFLLFYSFTSYKNVGTAKKIILVFVYQIVFIISNIFAFIYSTRANTEDYGGFRDSRIAFLFANNRIIGIVLLLIMFLHKKISKSKYKSKIYYLLLPVPLLSVLAMFFVLIYSRMDMSVELYNIMIFVLITVTPFSAICMYYLIYQTLFVYRISLKNKTEKELYENMLKMETKRYEDIQNSSDQIRKIRHDIKNMLYFVKAEIDENNIDKAKEELNKILNNVNSIGSVVESGNRTIDYIVNAKLGNIENRIISVSGDISGMDRLKNIDVSIILGNILDNAIEATNSIANAEIDLTFCVKNNYQNIICKNTVANSVLKSNPKLITVKKEKDNHGFGIKSVEEIVRTYDGLVEFFEENNIFGIHIMIPVE